MLSWNQHWVNLSAVLKSASGQSQCCPEISVGSISVLSRNQHRLNLSAVLKSASGQPQCCPEIRIRSISVLSRNQHRVNLSSVLKSASGQSQCYPEISIGSISELPWHQHRVNLSALQKSITLSKCQRVNLNTFLKSTQRVNRNAVLKSALGANLNAVLKSAHRTNLNPLLISTTSPCRSNFGSASIKKVFFGQFRLRNTAPCRSQRVLEQCHLKLSAVLEQHRVNLIWTALCVRSRNLSCFVKSIHNSITSDSGP